jgi:protein ImuB
MRRGLAPERCPELGLVDADDARDAREFEPVALAAETVVAGLEVARPGMLLLPAGDGRHQLAGERTGHECQVGVADGLLAAVLAARADAVVAPGASAEFLATHRVGELVHAVADPGAVAAVREAAGLWWRLGLRTLGDLAALPSQSVHARFGDLGTWAWRLARGEDVRPPTRRRVAEDLAVSEELDPPAPRVDVATFAARRLAERLHAMLVDRGLSCGRIRITAWSRAPAGGDEGADGAVLERVWRTDDAAGGMSAARITDRVRWQLEGWLTASSRAGAGVPAVAPVTRLTLTAEEVAPAGAAQPSLWGADAGEDARARRALGRVQGLLGGDAVLTVRRQGGRDPRDRVHLVPFGEDAPPPRDAALPWPGALPAPAPAVLLPEPAPAGLLDAAGRSVVVDARLAMSGEPRVVTAAEALPGPVAVAGWAGPWPLAERWWAATPEDARRRVYLQVVLDDGRGLLLAQSAGSWQLEAVYD